MICFLCKQEMIEGEEACSILRLGLTTGKYKGVYMTNVRPRNFLFTPPDDKVTGYRLLGHLSCVQDLFKDWRGLNQLPNLDPSNLRPMENENA